MLPLAITLFVFGANADQTPPAESLETRTMRRVQETPPTLDEKQPNEIRAGQFSYSGIAVQLVKTDIALELINPMAPREYGLAEANVVREPTGGRIFGLKIFSIEF